MELACMLDATVVGNIIREAREERQLSQEEVSRAAGIGRTHLSSIERGVRCPTLNTFIKISRAINCPAGDMLDAIEREMENR